MKSILFVLLVSCSMAHSMDYEQENNYRKSMRTRGENLMREPEEASKWDQFTGWIKDTFSCTSCKNCVVDGAELIHEDFDADGKFDRIGYDGRKIPYGKLINHFTGNNYVGNGVNLLYEDLDADGKLDGYGYDGKKLNYGQVGHDIISQHFVTEKNLQSLNQYPLNRSKIINYEPTAHPSVNYNPKQLIQPNKIVKTVYKKIN